MHVIDMMPAAFKAVYARLPPPVPENRMTEIRLRAHGCASVTYADADGMMHNHVYPGVTVTEDELRCVLSRFCGGSIHAYDEALRRGYLTPADFPGVRIGIAGRVLCERGQIQRMQRFGSMCIRLPHRWCISATEEARLRALFMNNSTPNTDVTPFLEAPPKNRMPVPVSTLFYAPPGVGKTTLLRALIKVFSDVSGSGNGKNCAVRCAVIDTGEELCMEDFVDFSSQPGRGHGETSKYLTDYFLGYPRGVGISIATRAFSPQLLVCDEIGDDTEADEILRSQASGVPLIATAHGDNLSSLLQRPCFRRLYDHRVFMRYIRIHRIGSGFTYQIEEDCSKSEE